ncbi:DUF4950 domain-containing protein [Enterococcus faecalis]|uniref:DUF4950 domain-containing protein n=1 Tax=unclassified Enterococcus TaxID=2608891 RepID=UPI001A06DB2A|nr:DUF4950 domain-containing protein [Enterococcus faecalis]EGO6689931.1 DUF4950 domain-containing protein [Enterococcus faecalis]EGO8519075.1 DUF4950 domain-containing protein [Enterococcus faecalis]
MKKMILLGLSLIMLAGCSSETKKEVKTKESSTTVTSTTIVSSSKTKEKESSSTVETSSVSTSFVEDETQTQVSLGDFVGGWGIPQSDNLFFINADGTLTSTNQPNVPLQNLSFSVDANGNQTMSYILNNTARTLVKNADGTLTAGGQIYSYLGNITMEQLIERNNQGQQPSVPTQDQDEQPVVANGQESQIQSENNQEQEVYDQLRDGETGKQFAERHGLSVEQLEELNNGNTTYYPNMYLRVK